MSNRDAWTFTDVLILAALFSRDDRHQFTVRRVLKRIERGEMAPREGVHLLNDSMEPAEDC